MTSPSHPVVWLHHADQSLGLVPSLGGAVAAWRLNRPQGSLDLWRPWDGVTLDLYQLASFAMVPWSNRISGGGFEHAGQFHPMPPNRAGEAYAIHGDGWLQPWQIDQPGPDTLVMTLRSRCFGGNPHDYEATQTFRLVQGGLDQQLQVRHLGAQPLPYGLGVHPWFLRTPQTVVTAPVQGVWLCGDDPLPTAHTQDFPAGWDLNQGVSAHGSLIDNGYTGWGGQARIAWPEHGLQLSVELPDPVGAAGDAGADPRFCLVYRPPQGTAFCFEPITQPIDAFHLPGRPGLRVLGRGEQFSLAMRWRVGPLDGGPFNR